LHAAGSIWAIFFLLIEAAGDSIKGGILNRSQSNQERVFLSKL
jgi:hypothetical protein